MTMAFFEAPPIRQKASQPDPASSEAPFATPPPADRRTFQPNASIILVGVRGAGKRTLGFIGAQYLRRRLLTEDQYFEQATGCTRGAFIQKHGREVFNSRMAVVLAQVLDANRFGCIIEGSSMGMLCSETKRILKSYNDSNPIIYVHRDKEDVFKLLKVPVHEAERYLRRDRDHRQFCNLEYHNLYDASGEGDATAEPLIRSAPMASVRLLQAKEDFVRFLDLVTGRGLTKSLNENPFSVTAIPPEFRHYSYVMRLRLSDLLHMDPDLAEFEAGGDAVELVVDTWPDDVLDLISTQVALIRRKLDLPVVYTVEGNPRERPRTPEERDNLDLHLLLHGLRLCVDYISIDLDRCDRIVTQVLAMRGRTRVIGNFDLGGLHAPQWTDDTVLERYVSAQRLGCQVVRIARFCPEDRPDELRQAFVDRVNSSVPSPKPTLVAFDYSTNGITIPFQSLVFNPVSHPLLEDAAPEQARTISTARGALRLAFRRGDLQSLKFYTFGSNVFYSTTAPMHRAAYEHYMLAHTYEARQCTDIEEVMRVRSELDFGGASIAPPFKVDIMSRVDYVSPHATAIGAMNLLLPLRGTGSSILDNANSRNHSGSASGFYGDNTDWASIATCLKRAINPRNAIQPSRTTALVVGAGGMARAAIYVLIKLGCRKVFIYNRTRANAERVADHFNQWAAEHGLKEPQADEAKICRLLDSPTQQWPNGFQQPTIILSCIPVRAGEGAVSTNFQMPAQWLESPTGGVVVELAHEPLLTPLVLQMRQIRESGNTAWVVVDGLEVVCEMAIEAFELMTGRKAPKSLMRRVCNETWAKNFAPFQTPR